MIQLADNLWIGDSHDERHGDLVTAGIDAVLNVAQDLQGTRGWNAGIEYMQVGLIDGPGNPLVAYHTAILALVTLLKRYRTLVCCHSGGRALTVSLMYLNLTSKRSWDGWLDLLRERIDDSLPIPHKEHRVAFNKINWKLLATAMEGE